MKWARVFSIVSTINTVIITLPSINTGLLRASRTSKFNHVPAIVTLATVRLLTSLADATPSSTRSRIRFVVDLVLEKGFENISHEVSSSSLIVKQVKRV